MYFNKSKVLKTYTVKPKDKYHHKIMMREAPFDKINQPIRNILLSKKNITVVNDSLKHILEYRYGVKIPDQLSADISDELEHIYLWKSRDESKLLQQRAGGVIKRALMGEHLLNEFKPTELGEKKSGSLKTYIEDINNEVIERLVKRVMIRVNRKQRYAYHKNMKYNKIMNKIMKKPNVVAYKKEIPKWMGKSYNFNMKMWKPRHKPQFDNNHNTKVPFYLS